MQIQVSTDHNIDGNENFIRHVEAELRAALSGFNGNITTVEVHFSDENGAEAGGVDKRCLLEVRTAHHLPVALGHTGETLEKALDGAAKKMKRVLESTLGRLHDHKGGDSIRKEETP
jgi:ribosome-associated translation inhibitor RaiA